MWLLWAAINRSAEPERLRGRWPEDHAADQDTVRRLAAGEPEALTDLYDRHARSVFSLVARIVEDQADAEDVTQEVFSQAWRQAGRFDTTKGSVAAWLLNMARSRAIDRLRANRAKPDSSQLPDERAMLELPDRGVSQEAVVLTGEQVERLRSALHKLPFLQRLAIELAYYEGLTQQEISERLEQPLGTVKTRIRLGLMKLRDALAEVQA